MDDLEKLGVPESVAHPRAFAVKEQRDRARFFLELASGASNVLVRFRLLVAAVYFGRAMVELMLEAARMDELVEDAASLEPRLVNLLPRYNLIEKIRIHDFHRHGVIPRPGFFLGGRVRIKAQGPGSGLQVQLTQQGPVTTKVGNANVVWNRPLQINDGRIFDEETSEWLSLDQIVSEYLSGADAAVAVFESLRKDSEA